jgi:hypothetical protein
MAFCTRSTRMIYCSCAVICPYPAVIWNFARYRLQGGYDVILFGSNQVTKIPRFLGPHSPCFGYPEVGTPDDKGWQIISYPVRVTQALQIPLKNDPVVVAKEVRLATKKRFAAQLYLL